MTLFKERTFSTGQVLKILHEAGLHVGQERLKVWHRRGIAPGNAGRKGHERSYTLKDLILIGSLVFMSGRVGQLRESATGFSARRLAYALAESVYGVFEAGPYGGVARRAKVYVISEDSRSGKPMMQKIQGDTSIGTVAEMFATGTATIVHPRYFALQLAAAIERVVSPASVDKSTVHGR